MAKARILVVEDERLVALSIVRCLQGMGYEVPANVASGEEAVRKVIEMEPDLVLMDVRLNGAMDGVEAASRIRDSFHVPIVYLTAYSEEKTLERAKATEPLGYITKPFEERTLQTTVEMALYKAMMDRELRRAKEKLETILRCIDEGVAVVNAAGDLEYLNPTAQRILLNAESMAPGSSLGQLFKLLDAETLEPLTLPVNRVLMNGESVEMSDLLLLTKDHGRILIDFNLAPLRGENANIRGMVLSFRDVSERKKFRDLVNRELHQALELQRGLLPSVDIAIPGLAVCWFFHAASLAAGDLFNVFPIDERHAGAYILDVAGHGISSVVNSLLLHRFLAAAHGPSARLPLLDADPLMPMEVVEKLSGRFLSGSSVTFFSILYAVIDTREGIVNIVRAGNPYPIWQRQDGSLRILRVQGHALGVKHIPQLTQHEIVMEPGDRLFLYSDGLSECTNPDMVPFSEDRLVALMQKTRALTLAETAASIDSQVLQWRASKEFDDDICLLALERA